jgi:hypothetical protein
LTSARLANDVVLFAEIEPSSGVPRSPAGLTHLALVTAAAVLDPDTAMSLGERLVGGPSAHSC